MTGFVLSPERLITAFRLRRHGLQRHMQVFSHTSPGERLTLFHLARRAPAAARALEIGSHVGSSALFLCAGLSPGGGSLICVDTWMNQTMPDGERDTFREFQTNTRPFAPMIKTVRKHSRELTDADIGGALDLAFVDGDHGEDAIRSDFELIAPWVRKGGFVAFHDLHPGFPGSNIVVGEALASGNWQLAAFVDTLGVIKRTGP